MSVRKFARVASSVVVVVIGLLIRPAWARADEGDFLKGDHTFSLTVGYTGERTGADQTLASVTGEYSVFAFDRISLGGQLALYRGHDDGEAYGAGVNLVGRWHFLNVGRVSFYGDLLGGVLELDDQFPDGGTRFNFTYAGGPGADVRLKDNLHLTLGFRFQHVSNGFIEGRDRNPVLNSLGGYVGLLWQLGRSR